MTAPATALGRHDRLWPAVLLSAAVHAALVAAIVVRNVAIIDLEQKPIVAKLVRLGPKKPEEYLPRKEEPPPPPAPAAPAAPPVESPSAAAPSPTAKGPAAKPAPGARSAPGATGTSSLANVLSRVRKQVDDTRWGDPQGDPNGVASEGTEGDRYLALVTAALQGNYHLPATISEKERLYLKATVVLYLEPDGRIARWQFASRSGNAAFDDALERAIRDTRLPPPPPESRERYRKVGIGVNFHI
jgi:colicin import membrane protein